MKKLSIILGIFFQTTLFANMAQPYYEGTLGGSPFINQHVSIAHENLYVTIEESFHYAHFDVTYEIISDTDGVRIPILFYATAYYSDFSVSVDGLPMEVIQASSTFRVHEGTIFNDFAYFFKAPNSNNRSSTSYSRDETTGFQIRLDDMHYFETNISKGKHTIHVTYNAMRWEDDTDWVKKYDFRYVLSPAKYWKNFGTLNLTIDASDCDIPLQINLNPPDQGDIKSVAKWHFTEIPTNVLMISYSPKISAIATLLTTLTPLGVALFLGVLLIAVHYFQMVKYRKQNPIKKWSLVVIIGSVLVPLIFVITWISSYGFIDAVIGSEASKTHGYVSIIIITLFPFITLLYLMVFWFLDKKIKKNLTS